MMSVHYCVVGLLSRSICGSSIADLWELLSAPQKARAVLAGARVPSQLEPGRGLAAFGTVSAPAVRGL